MTRMLTDAEVKSVEGLSSRAAAAVLGVGKTTINEARAVLRDGGTLEEEAPRQPKILTWDIESKPHLVYTWGLWDQNIGITQIKEHGGMICFAAKWLGSDEVMFYSEFEHGKHEMIKAAHDLLSEADIVVGYNSDNYDNKRINNEFLEQHLGPVKPFMSIDLIKTNRKRFDLASRKLDYIARYTGIGQKIENAGFQLWIDCMANDPEAWAKMKEYNIGDVIVTEDLYKELQPWLFNVPHFGMWTTNGDCCPYCGSVSLTDAGESHTKVQTYPLYRCDDCTGWSRGTLRLANAIHTRAVG